MNRNEIKILILRHLAQNPDASDTVRGITEWWITHELLLLRESEVATVVEELLREGLMEKSEISPSTYAYSIKKPMLALVKKIIADSSVQ